MKDLEIVDLLWIRDERALEQIREQYRAYLHRVAYQIVGDDWDCEEILNDTYLALWNSIPPHRPQNFATYAAKITRRLAIKQYRKRTAQKRVASEYALSLEELRETIGDVIAAPEEDPEALGRHISDFLRKRSERERNAFIFRYFYSDSIPAIASRLGLGESSVYKMLTALRRDLRVYLSKEGYDV